MTHLSSELFLEAILLLLHDGSLETKDIVTQLITVYEEDTTQTVSEERELHLVFVGIIRDLLKLPEKATSAEQSVVLLKFCTHPVLTKSELTVTALSELFKSTNKMEDCRIRQLRMKLSNCLAWHHLYNGTRQMFGKLSKCSSTVDEDVQKLLLDEVTHLAQTLTQSNYLRLARRQAAESIDLGDLESIQRALSLNRARTRDQVLRTGMQGLNMALGKHGGFVPGEFVVFSALSHQYKSGMLTACGRDFAIYNTPPVLPDGMIPIILHVSLENEAHKNMMWWFRTAYETTYQKTSAGLSDEETIAFLHEFYNKNGYRLFCERYDSMTFGIEELIEVLESYKARGYYVVACIIDYVNLMRRIPREGKTHARDDLLLEALYKALLSLCKTWGFVCITAHALNRTAADIANSGRTNVVRHFGNNMMADGMGVEKSIDVLIYLHLETNDYKVKYLTAQLRKHRDVDDTPETHKYFAYPFTQFGIMPDVGGPPGFTRDIYAEKESSTTDQGSGGGMIANADIF